MKKIFMIFVCLMTMVLSINAQNVKQLTKTLKTTIKCEDGLFPCWGENKYSTTSSTVTIDFAYMDECGSMLSLTLKNKGGEVYNYFEDASIYYINKEEGKVWMIYNNLDEKLLMLHPNKDKTYTLVVYDEAVMN